MKALPPHGVTEIVTLCWKKNSCILQYTYIWIHFNSYCGKSWGQRYEKINRGVCHKACQHSLCWRDHLKKMRLLQYIWQLCIQHISAYHTSHFTIRATSALWLSNVYNVNTSLITPSYNIPPSYKRSTVMHTIPFLRQMLCDGWWWAIEISLDNGKTPSRQQAIIYTISPPLKYIANTVWFDADTINVNNAAQNYKYKM